MASPRHYAALGSSFAAGPGIPPIANADAARSARNYPHLLAQRLGAQLTDLTVSGATTATILDESQLTFTGATFPPQSGSLPRGADLVTLTAGGNDLRYAASMLFTAWRKVDPGGPIATMMAPEFTGGIPFPTAGDVERTATGLVEIVARVRSRAPQARIILVDYLTVIGEQTAPGPGIPFEPEDIAVFRAMQSGLEDAYGTAAERCGTELVRISALSRGHALGASDPWVAAFLDDFAMTGGSFHPNAAGMAATAEHLEKVIRDTQP